MSELGDGYSLRPISDETYRTACAEFEDQIFDYFSYQWPEQPHQLPEISAQTFSWGYYCGEELVGWHHARQLDARTVLMADTGLLPAHQGRGLYTRSLTHLLAAFQKAGYTLVQSHHRTTNNAVIVPKLRAGFFISGLTVDDCGQSVILNYTFDDVYRQVLRVRSGEIRPTGEAANRLRLARQKA